MARFALECTCGWRFFIPGSTQGWETACPNCGLAVRIPGRRVGDAGYASAGRIAAARQRAGRMARWAVGLAVVLVGTLCAWPFLQRSPSSASEPEFAAEPSRPPVWRPPAHVPPPPPEPTPDPPPKPEPPPPPRPERPHLDIQALRHDALQATRMINIAGVVCETLRLRGMPEERNRIKAIAEQWERRLSEMVCRADEAGEAIQVEDHILPGEPLVGFAQRDLTALPSWQAADLMARWLGTFEPNSTQQVILVRRERAVAVYIDLPDLPKELLELARTPTGEFGKGVDGDSPVGEPAPTPQILRPEELFPAIEAAFSRLAPGYRPLVPTADRLRLEGLLRRRSGSPLDYEFLQKRILLEVIPAFEKEAAHLKARASELERKLKKPTAVDVIRFKGGRKVEGRILEQTVKSIRIEGPYGTVAFPAADVLAVEPGKGAGLLFQAKLKEAGGKLQGLVPLLGWCKEVSLKVEGEYVSCLILALDPANEMARSFLGLKRPL